MQKTNVLIVGTGLFGCHAAMTLKHLGIPFKMADITNDFFQGSSSKNQNRLHQGFHYARSYTTRHECMEGYNQFIKAYPFAAKTVKNNFYFVEKKSIMDYKTYKHIYEHENVPFKIVNNPVMPFVYNVDAFDGNGDAFLTSEMFVDFNELRNYFKKTLGEFLIKDYDPVMLDILSDENNVAAIYDKEEFTHLIDCTYFQLDINGWKPDLFYELCIAFLYRHGEHHHDGEHHGDGEHHHDADTFAFTIMDGPFLSLYPYDISNKIYSLTDVVRTPLIKTKNLSDVYALKNNLTEFDIANIQSEFEDNVKEYIPEFNKQFRYHGYYLAIKTKPNLNSDDRSLMYVEAGNRIHRFSGGKLTGIFPMEEKLKSIFG